MDSSTIDFRYKVGRLLAEALEIGKKFARDRSQVSDERKNEVSHT